MSCRRVSVHGTPREMGIQHGEAFRQLIRGNIAVIKDNLFGDRKLNIERYRDLTGRNAAFLQKAEPAQWQEMEGIAVGAGADFADILLINVPTYFLKNALGQECSMLLIRGEASADGCTYLAKNRDMGIQVEQVSVEYHYENGTTVAEVGGAGIVTYPALGVNSRGLTVTSTGFWSPKIHVDMNDVDNRHIFVNLHHILASCATVQDVQSFLDGYPRMNGLNIIAADKNSAAVFETTRNEYLVQWADESGVLFRTNHYTLGDHPSLNKEFHEYPSTFLRYQRLEEIFSERKKRRFQDIVGILSDHKYNPINGICRHASVEAPARTVSCTVCCLEDGELFNLPGNPCEHLVKSSL